MLMVKSGQGSSKVKTAAFARPGSPALPLYDPAPARAHTIPGGGTHDPGAALGFLGVPPLPRDAGGLYRWVVTETTPSRTSMWRLGVRDASRGANRGQQSPSQGPGCP